jgi:hypothetical protein
LSNLLSGFEFVFCNPYGLYAAGVRDVTYLVGLERLRNVLSRTLAQLVEHVPKDVVITSLSTARYGKPKIHDLVPNPKGSGPSRSTGRTVPNHDIRSRTRGSFDYFLIPFSF